MNNWLQKPWVIRILALVLAVLLFVVVAFDQNVYDDNDGFDSLFGTTNETQTLEDVPVQTQIDQDRFVVSGVPETVSVSLQGSVSLVTSTSLQRNFDVFVDLEGLSSGTHIVPIEYSGINERINVYIEPQEIEVSIEERGSNEFDVTMDVVNRDEVEAGYEVANVYAEPGTVQVTSSKSIVEKIAIVKAFVDVTGFNESQTINNVPVKVYDNQGNELNVRIDPPIVEVTIELKNPSKTVPISIATENELPEDVRLIGFELETEEVEVFAAEDYLSELTEITTEPIDLSEITESGTMEVELNLPQKIRKAAIDKINVNVEAETIEEETLEDVTFSQENVPEDLSVNVTEPEENSMNVTMKGFSTDLEQVTKDDLQLILDIGDRTPGEYQIPFEVHPSNDIPENVEFAIEFEEATVHIEQES